MDPIESSPLFEESPDMLVEEQADGSALILSEDEDDTPEDSAFTDNSF